MGILKQTISRGINKPLLVGWEERGTVRRGTVDRFMRKNNVLSCLRPEHGL